MNAKNRTIRLAITFCVSFEQGRALGGCVGQLRTTLSISRFFAGDARKSTELQFAWVSRDRNRRHKKGLHVQLSSFVYVTRSTFSVIDLFTRVPRD